MIEYFAGPVCDVSCESSLQPIVFFVWALIIISGIVALFALNKYYKKQKTMYPNGWVAKYGKKTFIIITIPAILIAIIIPVNRFMAREAMTKRDKEFRQCLSERYKVLFRALISKHEQK